ncbi:MAG: hypothetical protein KIT12_02045 [Trueperaceae bacterium]|nr:hypothetical protein [Trueperaceae bacterium]
MTRLRQAAPRRRTPTWAAASAAAGRSAVALRALIGLLSLALVVLGCLLLT